MTPARLRWGLFLILLGLLLLLQNLNVLNPNFWIDLAILFPIALIAVGIEKIFTNTRLRAISYLTSIALFVSGLGIAIYGSYGGDQTSFFQSWTFTERFDSSVEVIRANLDLDETDLTIRDSGRDLVYALFAEYTKKPDINHRVEAGEAIFDFNSRSGAVIGGIVQINTGDPQDWVMRFNEDIPLELTVEGRESKLDMNFATTPLRRLNLNADNSYVYLRLGDLQPAVDVNIFGEDAEVRLRLPKTVGLRVKGTEFENYLKTINLIRRDAGFVNEGYDSMAHTINVKLDPHLGSLSIDFF